MKKFLPLALVFGLTIAPVRGQNAVRLPQQERKQNEQEVVEKRQDEVAQRANIEFRGRTAFEEKELRSHLKEEIAAIERSGLTNARGDDAAFFLEVFYKKRGYAKVDVRYTLVGGDRLRLDITEGPFVRLGDIQFSGNTRVSQARLFEYAVGPTRERHSKLQLTLPFVSADLEEGADLVQRFYFSQGFVDCLVDPPQYHFVRPDLVNVSIAVHEGQQYFFGNISFSGDTIYGPEALRGQILDLLQRPFTEARLADIPRRLQAYFKARGYFAVKVDAVGDPALAINGRVPVRVTIDPGQVYYFDGVTVKGTQQLRPSFLVNRFRRLNGQPYSPDVLDQKFRALMRTSLFNLLQINPTPVDGNRLRLDIKVEEAKPQELGFTAGYGSFTGGIFGVQYGQRNLFGYGRPITTSAEISERGYKGEFTFQDPYLFETENAFHARFSALTFDYDGYSKFELGGRFTLSRRITDQYVVGLVFAPRYVEVTNATIAPGFLGRTAYFISSIGFTQTLDLRKNPLVAPSGFVFDNTLDLAADAIGSQIDLLRATGRVSYYLPFGPGSSDPVLEDLEKSGFQRWFERSSLAFSARAGVVDPLKPGGSSVAFAIPIDERFFNGGSTTVRSFAERDLGPRSPGGDPIGGEFYSIFNVEYTFPLYGEILGAVFVDAGNLLPDAHSPGLDDMRYALGAGLRYNLPIGPIRLDYGVNPNPRAFESFGAFHFSFGFAF